MQPEWICDVSYPTELVNVAQRVIWFCSPEEALKEPRLFLSHLMNFGAEADVQAVRKYFPESAFKDALDHAPPGIFTHSSWERWNRVYGRNPAPPLPKRFPEAPH